ncbi:MAG: YqaJ viral recombinase family protein, partial [Pseudomonadota bacterium]
YWIDRGRAMEGEARAFYELQTNIEARRVGFVWRDEGKMVGCSPDWIWADESGGAEVKCPKASTHISYLLGGTVADTYIPQVQGSMWVTGTQAWDFVSYFPDLPPVMVRVKRDPAYHAALDAAIPTFLEELLEARHKLAALGLRPGSMIIRAANGHASDIAAGPSPAVDPNAPLDRLPLLGRDGTPGFYPRSAAQAVGWIEDQAKRLGPGERAVLLFRNAAAMATLLERDKDPAVRARWEALAGT